MYSIPLARTRRARRLRASSRPQMDDTRVLQHKNRDERADQGSKQADAARQLQILAAESVSNASRFALERRRLRKELLTLIFEGVEILSGGE